MRVSVQVVAGGPKPIRVSLPVVGGRTRTDTRIGSGRGGVQPESWVTLQTGSSGDTSSLLAMSTHPLGWREPGFKAHLFPRGFDEWLDRCLRKNAAERWASGEEAVQELAGLAS